MLSYHLTKRIGMMVREMKAKNMTLQGDNQQAPIFLILLSSSFTSYASKSIWNEGLANFKLFNLAVTFYAGCSCLLLESLSKAVFKM